MRIILCGDFRQTEIQTVAREVNRLLSRQGAETCYAVPYSLRRTTDRVLPKGAKWRTLKSVLGCAEMMISIGTPDLLVRTAGMAMLKKAPFLGISTGERHALATLDASALPELKQLAEGHYTVEQCMALMVSVCREGEMVFCRHAVCDAVFAKRWVPHVLHVTVRADEKVLWNLSGDGLIVASPLGSAGYSLVAGGPIVDHTAESIAVTPICSHDLCTKPIILDAGRKVSVLQKENREVPMRLIVDGTVSFPLQKKDQVIIQASEYCLSKVRMEHTLFF